MLCYSTMYTICILCYFIYFILLQVKSWYSILYTLMITYIIHIPTVPGILILILALALLYTYLAADAAVVHGRRGTPEPARVRRREANAH